MQVVIDIPEAWEKCNIRFIKECIKNGIPLPENHGDLIDRSTLDMSQAVDGDRRLGIAPLWIANRIVENADVIIPATRGEEHKQLDTDTRTLQGRKRGMIK